MMTHIQAGPDGEMIIAAKGAPEAIITRSEFEVAKQALLLEKASALAESGLRLLAVGVATPTNDWPKTQQEFTFRFLGFFGFNDPPIENIADTISSFYGAGISVKMITGDYPQTAVTIAARIGLRHPGLMLTGNEVMALEHEELSKKLKDVNVYARMSPEAKMKVIKAMIDQGEVVAMTGDGVNDAPALKIAHVGVAMGKRGSEVAKNAAAIVINDDDLQHVVEAIAIGRKIYDNIKKSVRYIVSIHIPIILVVMLPLIFHWKYPTIFTPVHVVFLELLMGATCSIVYENEPMEPGTMQRPPRRLGTTFLSFRQLLLSVIQGLAITIGCLGVGFIYMNNGADETTTRTMVIVTLIFANVCLAIVNRSFEYSIFKTLRFQNPLMIILLAVSISVVPLLIYVPAARRLFLLTSIGFREIGVAFIAAAIATLWTEFVKRPPRYDENHIVK
jgi:Ca2+-transporting ATPase